MRAQILILLTLVALCATSCESTTRRGNAHNGEATSQQRTTPSRGGGRQSTTRRPRNASPQQIAAAQEEIKAAGVETKPTTVASSRRPQIGKQTTSNGQKMTGSEIFERYNPAVFMVFTDDGYNSYQGSGFFISSAGLAFSNYHVFEGTYQSHARIKTSDGRKYSVKEIIYSDADKDVILFSVDGGGKSFRYIPTSDRTIKVGDHIFTIGSPRGYENTLSDGMISQLRTESKYAIQISAPIDHGSSGGALINEYGEVIGITSAGRDDSGANLNFAIDLQELLWEMQ